MMRGFQGFAQGYLVDGRYEIMDTIGQGGFGIVYRARQIAIDRVVALKILLPEADTIDPQAVERFRREAVLISSLESPNTITLFEFGQMPDGLLYTVMELAKGVTLGQLIENAGRLNAKRTQHIISQVLISLHEAHLRGIIHRDLKPANIMVGEYAGQKDFVKVLDFGIAKILTSGDTQSTLALTGRIVGTPKYMAPEQLRGTTPTPACDLYAMGLVMYEMLTGGPAITATDMMEQVQAQLVGDDIKVPNNLPGVNPEFVTVVNRALIKEAAKRFQAADVFRKALEGAIKGASRPTADAAMTIARPRPVISVGQAGGAAVLTPQPMPPQQPRPQPTYREQTQQVPKKGGLGAYIIVAGIFFLLALGGVGFLMLTADESNDSGSDAGVSDAGTSAADARSTRDETTAYTPPPLPRTDLGTTAQSDAGLTPTPLPTSDLGTVAQIDPTADLTTTPPPTADLTTTPPPRTDLTTAPPPRADLTTTPPPRADLTTTPPPTADLTTTPPPRTDLGAATTPDVEVASTDTTTSTTPDVAPATEDIVEETAPIAASGTVEVEIRTRPAGARVYIGGERVGDTTTPLTMEVPADGTVVRIRARLSGYDSRSRNVSASDAADGIDIRLRETPSGPIIPIIE
jgi:serine/threonine-protein kinase